MGKGKKLNIVYIDFDDIQNPLLGAGQAVATYHLGKELVKRGHSLTVLCSRYPGCRDRVEEGITYKHIGFGTSKIRLNNLLFILAVPFAVRKICNADVVIECFTAPISTLLCPLWTRIPVIAMPSMFNAHEFAKIYHLPFHWVEAFGLKFYKYMLPYSDIDAGKAKRLNPHITYKIVPQGVSKEYFSIKHRKPQYIFFLGRLDMWQKGIDLLLSAYALVKDKIAYPLVIAGHGPDEKKVKEKIKALHLTGKVKMVGGAYGEKKKKLISESLYVAFPSRHDEMCLWTLEALASGMPHVIFDLPESTWIPKGTSLRAKPFDVHEYAQRLLEATEPQKNADMRVKAREYARQFTWEHVADEFESFVNEVLRIESHI